MLATLSLALALSVPQSAPAPAPADDPVTFGRAAITRALAGAALQPPAGGIEVSVAGRGDPESYVLDIKDGRVAITGADPNGAMYGALELAERITRQGAAALADAHLEARPFLKDRGLNVFLTLPWNYEKNDTDYDPAALVDPERWWFQNDDYWRTLLDEMAESRLNWLDIHGTWDISVTDAPNLYAYFIQTENYPAVGVAPEIKAKNLARLNQVIELAHARGIRVSLMAYEARLTTPHQKAPPYPHTEEVAYDYTRAAVEGMIRGAPKLDAIGFRIGESGHGGEFFNCYTEAVARSGRQIPLYTRSWVTRKQKVVPLARQSPDFTVEIKYNGEQWGPPYPIAGGRMAGWNSYSFEDYLSDSGTGEAKHLWPGNPTPGGGQWPAEPYKIVWQVRANGTHRIFPFYEPSWVRRSIQAMPLGTATGYTVEPLNAYYPASPRYYIAKPEDVWCRWIHQRDDLFLMLWGRLGYDPTTPDAVFDDVLVRRFGREAGPQIARAWKAASSIVPLAFTAFSHGPDHRDHAPELEWGGDADAFVQGQPFDTHVIAPVRETAAFRFDERRDLPRTRGIDGRLTTSSLASYLGSAAQRIAQDLPDLAAVPEGARGRYREIHAACSQLAALGYYYMARLNRANADVTPPDEAPATASSRPAENMRQLALGAWDVLAQNDFYRPFTDRLRMGTNTFHWKNERAKVAASSGTGPASAKPIDLKNAAGSVGSSPIVGWNGARLTWDETAGVITCRVTAVANEPAVAEAWLLVKPLPSSTYFHRVRMEADGNSFVQKFPRENAGHLIAADVRVDGQFHRIPDWMTETPYLVIPSRPGATPYYYSSQEALRYLKPASLDPQKHGLMVIGSRAWDFHHQFDLATQRKILDPVSRGMTLVVMQQDWLSGRYKADWLPRPIRVEDRPSREFDPGYALGLDRFSADGLMWQPFAASDAWEVRGNGGVAHLKHGLGDIWMVQARLIQTMYQLGPAWNLRHLLCATGGKLPVIIIDAGSEGAEFTTSVIPDLLNAHERPFLTLGEVIAQEQGSDCTTVVPGFAKEDAILAGRGAGMVRAWLEGKVQGFAGHVRPATREILDGHRDENHRALMRCLGLDPLPERTPLNARITATTQRDGYRIENLVYQSRPGFVVTAQVYVPDPLPGGPGTKVPVIMNPHGHWQLKKATPVVQARLISQARSGYLAMVVDSPGHSFEGNAHIERRDEGPHDDWRLLLGSANTTAIYTWDLMRGLDYLATRPEADLAHVGITGASGGGTATMYAFAADDRYACAVPVCYPTSLAINAHNGCPCNHVPGALQLGDRADILALRAPKPILVIGATQDAEFPPEGTTLTGTKLKSRWQLFDAADRVEARLFESGHDYNQAMREAAMGFFDLHLRGQGDGRPVPEKPLATEPPESDAMFCLPAGTATRTMRDIARERLKAAVPRGFDEVVALNGGLPWKAPCHLEILSRTDRPDGTLKELVSFESERGLVIPGVLRRPAGTPRAGLVFVSERGKIAAASEFKLDELARAGFACLAIDVRGFGELPGLDPRLMAYLGTADTFAMGFDAARAALALRAQTPRVGIVGLGTAGAQIALFGALIEPVDFVAGLAGMHEYEDAFDDSVPTYSIQPRADLSAPLSHLRSLVKAPALWSFRGDATPADLPAALERTFPK